MRGKWDDRVPYDFDVYRFFDAVIKQDAEMLRSFFEPDAIVIWSNTNEQFTVDEYIRANCEYPGKWTGRLENIDEIDDSNKKMVFVAKVWNTEGIASRVVSFVTFGDTENELIQYLDEYWCDISEPPEWRKIMNIGSIYDDGKMIYF
jgi:hypothetical protein